METIQDHLELVNRSKIQLDSARRVWLGQHSILYCEQSPTQTILEPPRLGQNTLEETCPLRLPGSLSPSQ